MKHCHRKLLCIKWSLAYFDCGSVQYLFLQEQSCKLGWKLCALQSQFIIKIFYPGLPPYTTDANMCSGVFVGCYQEHFYFNFLGNRGLLFEVWDDASDLTEAGPGYRWQFVPNASSPVRFLSAAKHSFRYSVILKRDEATAITFSSVRGSNNTWQFFIAEPDYIAPLNQSKPSALRSFWSSKYSAKCFIFPFLLSLSISVLPGLDVADAEIPWKKMLQR